MRCSACRRWPCLPSPKSTCCAGWAATWVSRMTSFIASDELRYAELFFHVFAHVAATSSLPASVFSRRYVAWSESLLGSASARPLADDARLLATEFPSH